MLKAISVASALLLAAACAAPSAADQDPIRIQKVRRIVTLGDSITQGGGRPGGYVWLINEYLRAIYPEQKIEVINAGISGHKSNDMLARFQRDVLDKKPDVVTISVGINDVWHGFTKEHPAGYGPRRVPLDQYRANVEKMIQAAQNAGVKVVLLTTTIFEDQPNSPRNLRVQGYNDALRSLARRYDVPVADQYRAFMEAWSRGGEKLTSDQVHMAPAGDRLMARTVLLALGVTERQLEKARAQVERPR